MPTVNELYNEADQLKNAGQFPEAIAKLQEVLAADPAHVLSHLALSILYGKVGQHDQAVRHGEEAVRLEPTDTFNYTTLSVVYQRAWAATQDPKYIQLAEEAKARGDMVSQRR
jgi:tetratricopeptide (TPR) repeat protein